MSKLHIRVETTTHSKTLLPWVAITRKSRESTESQFFALLGYPEEKLAKLTPTKREAARDALEFALRLLSNFEYVPENPERVDAFFESKLLNFETKILQTFPESASLHAVLGVTQDTKILFSVSGDISALQITPRLITNLAQTSGDTALNFDTFQSGTINLNSYLLFIPKQTGALLKSDELKNLTVNRNSERKLDYLEHIWQNRAIQEPFRAILLSTKPRISKSIQTTAVSIANLLNTEAKTEEMLSPPVFKPFIKNIRTAIQKIYHGLQTVIETYKVKKDSIRAKEQEKLALKLKTQPQTRLTRQLQPQPRCQIPQLPPMPQPRPKFYDKVPNLSRYLNNFSISIKQKLAVKRARLYAAVSLSIKQLAKKISRPLNTLRAEAIIARFNQLTLKSKTLLLLTVFFLFVFTESVLITLYHNRAAKAEQAIQIEVAAIRALTDEANASLIYGDETKTRLQTDEAKIRVARLPEFQKQIMRQFQVRSLRALKNVATKSTVAELNEYLRPIQEYLRHLVNIETPTPVDAKIISSLGLKNDPRLSAMYNKRLYELRPAENQIFKDGTKWIKDGTDVSKGVGLAIDGLVYVLDDTGKVLEFRKGHKTNFAIKNIDPTLSVERENTQCCASKIWTNENSDYLYILDPQEKRLVVFNKKGGALKAQYTSPAFTDLKDFSVNEKTKTAYLLNGENVVSIPLSHLQHL